MAWQLKAPGAPRDAGAARLGAVGTPSGYQPVPAQRMDGRDATPWVLAGECLKCSLPSSRYALSRTADGIPVVAGLRGCGVAGSVGRLV